MLWTAVIVGVLCIVVGVPFTYYWFRLSDRWAHDDQKRFGDGRYEGDRSVDDREEIRIIPPSKDQ
ncbi:MAG: hypothetical protein AAFR96_01710 [Planctomycetota bacterium]